MITIVTFDPFGLKKYQYTFRARCEENKECLLEDGAVRIFLNTEGENKSEVSTELIDLLNYIKDTTDIIANQTDSERIRRIHERVCKIKSSEKVGVKYMQAWEEKYYEREEGRKAGREEGMKALIETCIEFKISKEETAAKIKEKFILSDEEAREYMDQFWRNEKDK